MINRYAVILAAGQGTRMKSKLYKVLHPVCGKPMVQHVVDHLNELAIETVVTVVGHGAEMVKTQIGDKSDYVLQDKQLGTAHAVMQAKEILADKKGTTVVICGDTPLISPSTIDALITHHENMNSKGTILTARLENPTGYGRVVRSESGDVIRIVEHKDASESELMIQEINTGTYCFDNEALFDALSKVKNDNAQDEYYLPDVIGILKSAGEIISAYQTDDFLETLGVNDRVQLSQAEKVMKQRILEKHMRNGVSIVSPEQTYIEADVMIGQDTVIQPGSILRSGTIIGQECVIGPNTEISNCHIENETVIRHSTAYDSHIGSYVQIGPFAHIRPSSQISDQVKIGNFVEVKKSTLGRGSKASHLSYIGDAEIGEDVNIGCGTITVNYDGRNKHLTKVEDGAFIGCNSNLVAPVTIGKGAYVAAGSTITENVPGEALAIARSRQTNKEGYTARLTRDK
ncbi:bifunctional UDP-N-acetylglucosamine diphosphorylase/glucosamine-1-phosphate N-acetyltransferase GlmU [Bacillus solimangrovi]|uniref:Bifunctional protein GlmU n=1 Tax=Bacillus solimangrovi TaxID=1305675 RepID=A0A1E5LEZ0_9BACI|nr:bifunctional UDP-N-acetylglucosamine diphosphorylase/glucosamine-1-phosphate N-acetyltransferase GlmU [Bacillus solimangrovi]OEH92630.1 UDP-N-acetylglucosamine diphosphorylase/glucosamine-1-phosphate N-acetyltransferase [Bacillus solimangrovi]